MTTRTLNGRDVMLVEVPEELKITINESLLNGWNNGGWHGMIELPPGFTYSILLDTKEAGEEDYIPFCTRIELPLCVLWMCGDNEPFATARKAVHRSIGLDTSKRWIVLLTTKK